jgi:hypothetical protein
MLIACVGAINLPCDNSEFCGFMEDAMDGVGCECICGCGTVAAFELSPANPSYTIPTLITLPHEFSFATSSATDACFFTGYLGGEVVA